MTILINKVRIIVSPAFKFPPTRQRITSNFKATFYAIFLAESPNPNKVIIFNIFLNQFTKYPGAELNESAIDKSTVLSDLKTHLDTLSQSFEGQGQAEITPFPKKIRDLAKRFSIQ
jgi:hypothetical protein